MKILCAEERRSSNVKGILLTGSDDQLFRDGQLAQGPVGPGNDGTLDELIGDAETDIHRREILENNLVITKSSS